MDERSSLLKYKNKIKKFMAISTACKKEIKKLNYLVKNKNNFKGYHVYFISKTQINKINIKNFN